MNQPRYPQGPVQPPVQPPKKGKGCWIAAAVVGGVLVIFAIVVGVFCVGLVKKGAQLAQEGLNAPGAKELEKIGCRPGIVMDVQQAAGLFGLGDAAASAVASS